MLWFLLENGAESNTFKRKHPQSTESMQNGFETMRDAPKAYKTQRKHRTQLNLDETALECNDLSGCRLLGASVGKGRNGPLQGGVPALLWGGGASFGAGAGCPVVHLVFLRVS